MRRGWANPGQLAHLGQILTRAGLPRDARLDYCGARVGRRLDTSAELTAAEAAALITELGRARLPRQARPK